MSARLAAMAEKHYREYLPAEYAALNDPTEFFRALGQAAQEQVEAVAEALRGPDPVDEPFVEKMARFAVARQTAESEVIREMVLPMPPDEPDPDEAETDAELIAAMADFNQAVREFYEAD